LLELAEKNGVNIDSGCRAGNCGTCAVAIKSGEVKYLHEPGADVEAGSCLTCIAVPKTALVLDA
jgi:ferredoxin